MSQAQDSYKIKSVQSEDDKLSAEVYLHPDHELFAGHFPGNPVMPGVLNIEIMGDVMKEIFPDKQVIEVSTIKFLNPVRPFEGIDLHYDVTWKNGENDVVKVTATGIINEAIFVKMQFKLAPSLS